jgi:hypothetical protein
VPRYRDVDEKSGEREEDGNTVEFCLCFERNKCFTNANCN